MPAANDTPTLFEAIEAEEPIRNLDSILSAAPDVNGTNRSGDTPLHLAVENNNAEATELLILAGADVV